jgi:selenide,water dikinase
MRTLNRGAAEALSSLPEAPHAVTDVTGFGLLGHAWEMAERSRARLDLEADALPLYPGALAAAEAGVRTGGDRRNRSHLEAHVDTSAAPAAVEALAYDPQTSGGLLASLPAAVVEAEGDRLAAAGFRAIGRVTEGPASVRLG